jgi:hypothetical protein
MVTAQLSLGSHIWFNAQSDIFGIYKTCHTGLNGGKFCRSLNLNSVINMNKLEPISCRLKYPVVDCILYEGY